MSAPAQSLIGRHPLQRLESPSRSASALLHLAGLASFAASFKYLVDFPSPVNDSYGWHLQYLTIIGLSLSTLTFAFGLLADVTLSPRLFLVKNALSVTSAPLEVLITLLYWGIRSIDKKLVMPDWVRYPYPLFEALSPPWRVVLFAGSALVMSMSTATLKFLYGRVNGYGDGRALKARPGAVKQ
ncbi:MAG: hypothetical protein M1819_004411 [Sarea resinae]|nr:MAG: hypothetical protein M1819_004411 [Sarea resinae]